MQGQFNIQNIINVIHHINRPIIEGKPHDYYQSIERKYLTKQDAHLEEQ